MPAVMGEETSPDRVVVLRAGNAFRVDAAWAKHEFENHVTIMHPLLRFTQALMAQMSQVGACNCHHSLEQRLSRWLLLFDDRAKCKPILCTQESLANTLGVRRERLAVAASSLQKLGLINYSRGSISLSNLQRLKSHSCECYSVIKRAYDGLIPNAKPP